jgi:lysine-specific demethylase/histidyl-hydroxylase NO66
MRMPPTPTTTPATVTRTSPTPETSPLRRLTGDAAEFSSSALGLRPHRHRSEGFGDLFSLADADESLASRGLRRPAVRLVQNGDVLPSSKWTRRARTGSVWIDDLVDPAKTLSLFAEGATIVFQSLQRWWPSVAEFCRSLEDALGHPVQANAYLTPAGAAGLDPHHDTHDVFVLQVHGSKSWIVREPVLANPLPHQHSDHQEAAAQPVLFEAELEPGDCLYLPRGFVHSARAQREASLHLTLGVLATTAHDVARDLLERAVASEVGLRRALPALGSTDITSGDVKSVIADLIAWLESADAADIAGELQTSRRTRAASLAGQLRELVALDTVDDATVVRLRDHTAYDLRTGGDELAIGLAGRTLRLPPTLHAAVEVLLDGGAHPVADLATWLDEPSRLVLVRRLIREGVLVTERG